MAGIFNLSSNLHFITTGEVTGYNCSAVSLINIFTYVSLYHTISLNNDLWLMTSHRYSPGAIRQFSQTPSWTLVGVDPGLLIASPGGSAETSDLGDLRVELL